MRRFFILLLAITTLCFVPFNCVWFLESEPESVKITMHLQVPLRHAKVVKITLPSSWFRWMGLRHPFTFHSHPARLLSLAHLLFVHYLLQLSSFTKQWKTIFTLPITTFYLQLSKPQVPTYNRDKSKQQNTPFLDWFY